MGGFFVGGGWYSGILTMLSASGYRRGMSDNKPVISDEAVAAAFAAHLAHKSVRSPDNAKNAMRAALEAAAPFIAAEAWEEGANAYFDQPNTIAPCWANPYRSQA